MKIPHGHRVSRDGQGMPLDVMAARERVLAHALGRPAVAAPRGSLGSGGRAPARPARGG